MESVVPLLFVLAIYLLPTIIAFGREHHLASTIFVVNLFTGWTFVGWVVALAMAVGPVRRTSEQ